MSSCGNCDCADKSQCVKKGNGYTMEPAETRNSYFDELDEVSMAENGCKCGAGSACKCVNCNCGAH